MLPNPFKHRTNMYGHNATNFPLQLKFAANLQQDVGTACQDLPAFKKQKRPALSSPVAPKGRNHVKWNLAQTLASGLLKSYQPSVAERH